VFLLYPSLGNYPSLRTTLLGQTVQPFRLAVYWLYDVEICYFGITFCSNVHIICHLFLFVVKIDILITIIFYFSSVDPAVAPDHNYPCTLSPSHQSLVKHRAAYLPIPILTTIPGPTVVL